MRAVTLPALAKAAARLVRQGPRTGASAASHKGSFTGIRLDDPAARRGPCDRVEAEAWGGGMVAVGTWNLENLYRPGGQFGPQDQAA